jgi:hypothetical protein
MKGEANIRAVSGACGLTSDYTRFLCKSLAQSGHLEFVDANACRLLQKGRSRFETSVASEPAVIATSANVTLLTDEQPQTTQPAISRSDGEKNQERDGEEKEEGEQASDDEDLDKALADLEPSSKKDESKEKDTPEEPQKEEVKAEGTIPEAEVKAATNTVENKEEKAEVPVTPLENPETASPKKEPVKPSGWSMKRIVNWFTAAK